MTRDRVSRCPVCRSTGKVTAIDEAGKLVKVPCLPCAASGKLEIIPREQCQLQGKWLPIERVAAAKAGQKARAA